VQLCINFFLQFSPLNIVSPCTKFEFTAKMVGGGNAAPGFYDAALQRRQTLMGKSGPAALVKNGKVFMIAMFACIGGLLYGV
jgi:hypothetical protein